MATIDDEEVPLRDDKSPLNDTTTSSSNPSPRIRSWLTILRKKCLLPFIVVLVIVAVVCFSVLFFMQPPVHYGPSEFSALLDDYWAHVLSFDPITATFVGITTYNDRWPILTNASLESQRSYYSGILTQLDSYRPFLNEDTQLSFAILKEELKYRLVNLDYQRYLIPILQMGNSPQVLIPQLIASTPFNSDADYNNYLQRLKTLPLYLQNVTTFVNDSERMNITLPQIIANLIPPQVDSLLVPPASSVFFKPFVSRGKNDSIHDEALQVVTNQVIPAFSSFKTFVEQYALRCRTTIGVSDLPGGAAFYESQVAYYTTTTKTPVEVHNIGLSEVSRIVGEMNAIAAKYNQTFQEFVQFLRTDPQFYATTQEEYLQYTKAICKTADAQIPALFSLLPRCPYGVVPIPDNEAPTSPSAYYQPPDGDCRRPGLYNTNTFNLTSRPLYTQPSTSLHEAVPGHHLQIAIQQELDLPTFRKFGGWNAYTEGWGLYAESLGTVMKIYTTDYILFGRYSDEILRACRLVVDTGMHFLNMSRQEAIDFVLENSAMSLRDITAEIDRYIAWPGQALGYKIGELKIQELRQNVTSALGENFDVREFHEVVLGQGAMPLSTLEEQLLQYYCRKYSVLCSRNK